MAYVLRQRDANARSVPALGARGGVAKPKPKPRPKPAGLFDDASTLEVVQALGNSQLCYEALSTLHVRLIGTKTLGGGSTHPDAAQTLLSSESGMAAVLRLMLNELDGVAAAAASVLWALSARCPGGMSQVPEVINTLAMALHSPQLPVVNKVIWALYNIARHNGYVLGEPNLSTCTFASRIVEQAQAGNIIAAQLVVLWAAYHPLVALETGMLPMLLKQDVYDRNDLAAVHAMVCASPKKAMMEADVAEALIELVVTLVGSHDMELVTKTALLLDAVCTAPALRTRCCTVSVDDVLALLERGMTMRAAVLLRKNATVTRAVAAKLADGSPSFERAADALSALLGAAGRV